MPIETVQRFIHVTTRKNQLVMRNIDRLWLIGQQATTDQDILDALHPWKDHKDLYFYNNLPRLLFVCGVLTCLFGWLIHHYIPFFLSFMGGLGCCFLAYLTYESRQPIDDVIAFLEERIMYLRYELNFNTAPAHIGSTASSLLVISKLRQSFPLFTQGNKANDFVQFASTLWLDEHDRQHQVMLFQYHYVNEVAIHGIDTEKHKLIETHKDQWGVFVFQIEAQGFAASNKHDDFPAPYTKRWRSSDIGVNQKIYIAGYDEHQLARSISPSMTLKLSDFFQQFSGDIIYHFQENMLCFCGDRDLFKISAQKKDIRDISTLRGHLRTLRMPEYEKFRQSMLNLIA